MLLTLLICLITGAIVHATSKRFGLGTVDRVCAITIFGLLGSIPGVLVTQIIGYQFEQMPVVDNRVNLASLRQSDAVAGSFFLGSGYIGDQMVFYYYEEWPDGRLIPKKTNAEKDVFVYEEDRDDGELLTYRWEFRDARLGWLFFSRDGHWSEFHIPKGSLKREFTIG